MRQKYDRPAHAVAAMTCLIANQACSRFSTNVSKPSRLVTCANKRVIGGVRRNFTIALFRSISMP